MMLLVWYTAAFAVIGLGHSVKDEEMRIPLLSEIFHEMAAPGGVVLDGGFSLEACARECLRQKHCKCINYLYTTGECHLVMAASSSPCRQLGDAAGTLNMRFTTFDFHQDDFQPNATHNLVCQWLPV